MSFMSRLRLVPIILLTRLLVRLLKLSGRGSGTALPGLLVNRYFPFAFADLVSQIPKVVVVTGTNGKTTTQTMLSAILHPVSGLKLLRNKSGANLAQGILSQLLREAHWSGRLEFTHAVFEVEEATLPRIAHLLRPGIIAVTNLYRDQLDAYGEVDITEKLIRSGIAQCPQAEVVTNGDDPRTSRLTEGLPNVTYFTSLPEDYAQTVPYEGEPRSTAHVSDNILRAKNIQVRADLSTDVTVEGCLDQTEVADLQLNVASPGFFHVYNALSAIAIAKRLGVSDRDITQGFQQFQPAFGRGEILTAAGPGNQVVNYQVLLVKNPVGLSLSLDLLSQVPNLKLLFAINDNIADSRDVSWLWDSQLELLNKADIDWLACTGIRAKDMAVRLKYALDPAVYDVQQVVTEERISSAVANTLKRAQAGDTIYVLPTYTAMLEFRKVMGRTLDLIPE
ncbi:MAG: MurT ligase domain-containing protein [Cyanobacteria bacterium P01_H01_bin.119]